MPLKLRSEATARKIGKTIGVFEEMDMLDNHRIGKFMCITVSLDLRNPLKTGIIITSKEETFGWTSNMRGCLIFALRVEG